MLRRFHLPSVARRLPSPSVVIATAAVVLAAAGTASAAKLIAGAQVRDSSPTGSDIKSKSIPGGDLRDGAIGTTQSSAAVRSRLGAGTAGPAGPAGTTGQPGAAGAADVQIRVSSTVTVGPSASNTASGDCPAGETAVGGGASSGGVQLAETYPTTGYNGTVPIQGAVPTGWKISGKNPGASNTLMTAYVLCAAP